MTVEQMRNVLNAKPFAPFIIHLADGRQIPVLSREFAASSPSGRTIVVYQPDESMNTTSTCFSGDRPGSTSGDCGNQSSQ